METASQRRWRKLTWLAAREGGAAAIASRTGLSAAALDQILKGTLLPRKQDGTRSARSLGDAATAIIERAYDLGPGSFDAPGPEPSGPALSARALALAADYDAMTQTERARLELLFAAARDVPERVGADASQPADEHLGGRSGFGALDTAHPPRRRTP